MPTFNNQFFHAQTKQPDPGGLATAGPILQIEIQVPQAVAKSLSDNGQPIPKPIVGYGLVDTGASFTCVDEAQLKALLLNPVGVASVGTANGPAQQNVYACHIRIPAQDLHVELSPVLGANLSSQHVMIEGTPPLVALLGRNLLQFGVLVYNGTYGVWSFSV